MNTDRLNSIHPHVSAQEAYSVASALDALPTPENRLMALAVAFVTITDEAGLDVSQVLESARRSSRDADSFYDRRVSAMREWAKAQVRW